MSNYIKSTNFATKDSLTTGNPLKTVSGTEIDDEFENITDAIESKANSSNAALTGVPTVVGATLPASTNSTQIATTAFTQAAIVAGVAPKAPIDAPTFTGIPAAPTAAIGTDTTQLATTEFANAAVAALVIPAVTAAVVNALVYPVGSIFTTTTAYSAASLATLMGVGTWAAFSAGRVMLGAGGGYTAGATGGSTTDSHVLQLGEMPQHVHGYTGVNGTGNPDGAGDSVVAGHANSYARQTELDYEGSNQAHTHDIMQPYLVVYFWKRVS